MREDSRGLAGQQRPRTKIVFQRLFWTWLEVLEPPEDHAMSTCIRTQSHRAQIHDEEVTPCRREPVGYPQSH